MGWFRSNDKASLFKESLKAALNDGDTEAMKQVLEGMGDLPKVVLTPALETAIENQQLASIKLLLKYGAPARNVNRAIMRDVAHHGRTDVFQLLYKDVDFRSYANMYSSADAQIWFGERVANMEKIIEVWDLKQQVTELKAENERLKADIIELRVKPKIPGL